MTEDKTTVTINLNFLRKLIYAYLFMWGLAYLVVAFVDPEVSGFNVAVSALTYALVGTVLIVGLFFRWLEKYLDFHVGRAILAVLGTIEVYAGVVSWTGLSVWNVPFASKELFQVSMAFADLISATLMFYLVIE